MTPEIKGYFDHLDQSKGSELPVNRPIVEYPFYHTRLREIDYKTIIAKGEQWSDPYFKADRSSLYDNQLPKSDNQKLWDTYEWKRASEVYGTGDYRVFDNITPTDIKQGDIGNCYYLSSISSLAEFPDRVKAIFLTKEVNSAGCYALKFFINGEPEIVVVDDSFPYCNSRNRWAFSRSTKENELWV